MKLLLTTVLVSLSVHGQDSQGVAAPWDEAKSVAELAQRVSRLQPIVEQLNPSAWVEKGAPETYVAQWEGAKKELGYMADAAAALEKQPEKLTAALDTYFRMQAVEWRINALLDGVRKYQEASVGDRLASTLG